MKDSMWLHLISAHGDVMAAFRNSDENVKLHHHKHEQRETQVVYHTTGDLTYEPIRAKRMLSLWFARENIDDWLNA
jgi:hypothetical protein